MRPDQSYTYSSSRQPIFAANPNQHYPHYPHYNENNVILLNERPLKYTRQQTLTPSTPANYYTIDEINLLNSPEFVPISENKSSSNDNNNKFNTNWFYTDLQNQPKGPCTMKDLEILYLNKTINSYSYVFNGNINKSWFRICDDQLLHNNLYQFQRQKQYQYKDNMKPPGLLKKKQSIIYNDHYVIFDQSEARIIEWKLDSNLNEIERFCVRFEPLIVENFDFKLMISSKQNMDNSKLFTSNSRFNDLKLKNKIDSLLNYINLENKNNENKSKLLIESYSMPLFYRINKLFKYHIYENMEILIEWNENLNNKLSMYDMNKINKLQNMVIDEWRNKIFIAVALDLFYENVIKWQKYGILYSLDRLTKIIKKKINYFLISRTYFSFLMKVSLIKFNKNNINEPIKIENNFIGHKLNGNNFGKRPSWIEIYFSFKFKINSTECNMKSSINDSFYDDPNQQIVHFKDILNEFKIILNGEKEYNDIKRYKLMELLIKNENKIMNHKSILCLKCNDISWNKYVEDGVNKKDIYYLINNFQKLKAKWILETPKRNKLMKNNKDKKRQKKKKNKEKKSKKMTVSSLFK